MTTAPTAAQRLYSTLPAVYRARDGGDLARLLEAFGGVLDLVRGALEQRLADAFPDHAELQEWLVPYFADLVDARLASPDAEARREEMARAIPWRQRKGTVAILATMADVVGRYASQGRAPAPVASVRVHEGWRRVAVTPRIGDPWLDVRYHDAAAVPAGALGASDRDPRLPTATVDLRYASRRVRQVESSAARTLQLNPAGVPAYPGSWEDAARRTPDLRAGAPTAYVHPRRMAVFAPPRPAPDARDPDRDRAALAKLAASVPAGMAVALVADARVAVTPPVLEPSNPQEQP